jgi:hypothetical protein
MIDERMPVTTLLGLTDVGNKLLKHVAEQNSGGRFWPKVEVHLG